MRLGKQSSGSKRPYIVWSFLMLLMILMVAVFVNRVWLYDWVRGLAYEPSEEMLAIKQKLNLTARGDFLFEATQPVLNKKEDFNQNCATADETVAILGCYTDGNVYIYNITDDKLDGIRELTTAHELLHAVYARLPEKDKQDLKDSLDEVYRKHQEVLQDDLAVYDENEQLEELYVRAGTEIKDLPGQLEAHYGQIFADQDSIVGFYEKYIKVFRELEKELENLEKELSALNNVIQDKSAEYETRSEQLNKRIASFNSCAETAGCFQNMTSFTIQRNELIAEQGNLSVLYEEINNLIDQYNEKVELYNQDVVKNGELQQLINSHAAPEGLK